MRGHTKQVAELLEFWEEFKALGFPSEEWEKFYLEKMAGRSE
jgi:hypothetical protein